jgi:hypothetical protein
LIRFKLNGPPAKFDIANLERRPPEAGLCCRAAQIAGLPNALEEFMRRSAS